MKIVTLLTLLGSLTYADVGSVTEQCFVDLRATRDEKEKLASELVTVKAEVLQMKTDHPDIPDVVEAPMLNPELEPAVQ